MLLPLLGLCLLQYLVLLSKRFDDEKQRQQLYRSRVRQTEVLMLLLHTLCSGAAFLLPCIVIHLTQVGGRVLLGTCGVSVPGAGRQLWLPITLQPEPTAQAGAAKQSMPDYTLLLCSLAAHCCCCGPGGCCSRYLSDAVDPDCCHEAHQLCTLPHRPARSTPAKQPYTRRAWCARCV